MDDVNIWILPDSNEILVTDQTGGVPVEACNWSESTQSMLKKMMGDDYSALFDFKGDNAWHSACLKADALKAKMPGFQIRYDNWVGRDMEAENESDGIDYHDGDY